MFQRKIRYEVPVGLANWHDIGPEVDVLRNRSRRWGVVMWVRRILVAVGVDRAFLGLIASQPGPLTSSQKTNYTLAVVFAAAGFALTPLCRRLGHPMYSPRYGRAEVRELHSLYGSVLRLIAVLLFFPVLVYVVPLFVVVGFVAVISVIAGQLGAAEALAALVAVAVGYLILRGFTSAVRRLDQQGLRHRAPSAVRLLAQDQRPFFLYLRTFQDDAVEIRAGGGSRRGLVTSLSLRRWLPFEEVLAWRFRHYGPIVAGNDPNAFGLATLGAQKLFLSVDPTLPRDVGVEKWLVEIEREARRSKAVLVSAAPVALQRGVRLELEMLGCRLSDHPMLLIVPPEGRRSSRSAFLIAVNRAVRAVRPGVGEYKAQATVAERWTAFNDFVQTWKVFAGVRELNTTGAAHLLVHVPGEGWSAWGAGQRNEWTYAVALMRAMDYAMERWPAAPQPQPQPQDAMPCVEDAPRPVAVATAVEPVAAMESVVTVTVPGAGRPQGAGPAADVLPDSVRKSVKLMYVAMAAYIPSGLVLSTTIHNGEQSPSSPTGIIFFMLVVPLLVWAGVAYRCLRGGTKARSAATVLFGLGCLTVLLTVGRVQGGGSRVLTAGFLAPALASVILLWRKGSPAFFDGFGPAAAPPGLGPDTQRLGPDTHRIPWDAIPATVRAAIALMCAGAAMFVVEVYVVLYRVFHEAQNDPQSTQVMGVPFIVLLAAVVLGAWIWTIRECRYGRRRRPRRQRGRVVATVSFGLAAMAVAASLGSGGSGAFWRVLFLLDGLAAVVLLWLPQSASQFVQPSARD
jgi:hypothetical protein